MLSQKMIDTLNDQIRVEFESSNLYLQMAAWCAVKGLEGGTAFLSIHAEEERMHGMKLFTYLSEIGALALVPAQEKPQHEYTSLEAMFTQILEHEKFVTGRINTLVALAYEEKDYSTLNFLQWYVSEQHEEEALFSALLDKIRMIGHEGRGLYFIDKELGKKAMASAAASAAKTAA
ncbi:MAG: non-heme ferritin [Ignavibacteriae bacterium]|nr:non-heme ferritin [Ignavibacteriota bacterium]